MTQQDLSPEEQAEAQQLLAEIINNAAGNKRPKPWYKPNLGQMIFGWIVGIVGLLIAVGQASEYDGSPALPAIIGIVSIAWALGFQRKSAQ